MVLSMAMYYGTYAMFPCNLQSNVRIYQLPSCSSDNISRLSLDCKERAYAEQRILAILCGAASIYRHPGSARAIFVLSNSKWCGDSLQATPLHPLLLSYLPQSPQESRLTPFKLELSCRRKNFSAFSKWCAARLIWNVSLQCPRSFRGLWWRYERDTIWVGLQGSYGKVRIGTNMPQLGGEYWAKYPVAKGHTQIAEIYERWLIGRKVIWISRWCHLCLQASKWWNSFLSDISRN